MAAKKKGKHKDERKAKKKDESRGVKGDAKAEKKTAKAAAKAERKAAKKAAKEAAKAAKAAKKEAKAAKVAKAAPKQAKAKSKKSRKSGSSKNPWTAYADALEREVATTLKVMRAHPVDQHEFQPHPRSGSAMQLFNTFGIEQGIALAAINGTLTMPPSFPPPPATLDECVAAFEQNATAVVAAARAAKASHHSRTVPFFTGPQTVGDVPAGFIAELMLADQIHHRGQLSVYVRMAGGKVPSIYGPSADEPW